eukprot:279445_1
MTSPTTTEETSEEDLLITYDIDGDKTQPTAAVITGLSIQIPSDDDTDHDTAHTSNTKSQKNGEGSTHKTHNTQYEALENERRHKRGIIVVLCALVWSIIIIGATIFVLYYLGKLPFVDTQSSEQPMRHQPTPTTPPLDITTTYIPAETTSEPTVITSTAAAPTGKPIPDGGNLTVNDGVIHFPPDAFPPHSTVTITIGEATDALMELFYDTTSAFQTMNMDNITNHSIHLEVNNMPLQTPNVAYRFTLPIPSDLLQHCPSDYGYEIFIKMDQIEFPRNTFDLFALFESTYDPTHETLTTHLVPEVFQHFVADMIVSCTPGTNIVPVRRRSLLQNDNHAMDCKASEIICPIQDGRCIIRTPFGSDHYGVDYASRNQPIVAAHNGVVERTDTSSGTYGQVIVIRGEDGSATLYANLEEIQVLSGESVTRGDVIARAKPTHLHFEYIPNGRIYATKKRINPSDCFPTFDAPDTATTQAPVPSNTAQTPTVSNTARVTVPSTTLHLPEGFITLRDTGRLADDSFAGYIDGFKVCETSIGQPNTCAINFLRPGEHTLTVEVLIADDDWGTFNVQLSGGWLFTDGSTSKDQIDDFYHPFSIKSPPGWQGSWRFTVPFTP